MRGGARTHSGPAPKRPEARRRTNTYDPEECVLPVSGYAGEIPEWPFPTGGPRDAVRVMWEYLWRRPQGAAWARFGYAPSVARLAMLLVDTASPDATAAALTEVRRLEEQLGLTPMAMKSLRWRLEDQEPAAVIPLRPVERRERPVATD